MGTGSTSVCLLDASKNDLMPVKKGTVLRDGPIRAFDHTIPVLEFDPPAWLGGCKRLPHQPWPVPDRASQVACMDEIERFVFVGPLIFNVVDDELDIGRNLSPGQPLPGSEAVALFIDSLHDQAEWARDHYR